MEGGGKRDPGYDDWFDEPEPPSETQTATGRGVYDGDEEVWVVPEEEDTRKRDGGGGIVIGGRRLTNAQAAIIGVSIIAILLAILAAAGVFDSGPAPVPTVTTQQHTVTHSTPTTTTTAATTQAPDQTLEPGDTGAQVTKLQVALNSLGYSVGKPDGVYGPATQTAVEQFQAANNLATDGVVGPRTLAALQQALSG
jgi:putative peptidoglycan binding protein